MQCNTRNFIKIQVEKRDITCNIGALMLAISKGAPFILNTNKRGGETNQIQMSNALISHGLNLMATNSSLKSQ